MSKRNAISPESKSSGRQLRVVLAVLVGIAWGVLSGMAYFDVPARSERERVSKVERLEAIARVSNLLYLAEESRIDGELARLRTELRAQKLWAETGGDTSHPDDERREIDGRQLDGLLRRGLSAGDSFGALELIVAGPTGLMLRGFGREGSAIRRTEWTPSELDGTAKALWYSDEVQLAVASAGRRVERGEITFAGEIERPGLRAAIGLHEPGEMLQGVLTASMDLTRLAGQLSGLAAQGERVTLASIDGRPLDPTRAAGSEGSRWADLTRRVLAEDASLEPFLADGRLVLGRPMARVDASLADLVVLIEVDAPAAGVAAWLATPWPATLSVLSVVSLLAVVSLLRHGDAIGAAAEVGHASASAGAAEADSLEVSLEDFALRAWLADVRGCLEREAATRGLSLALRCERSLPDGLRCDPGWLGGLLVAMGREALDATPEQKVILEVLEEAGNTLRFEIDAGDVDLYPVRGMQAVAASLGGRLEPAQAGRLALVLPSVLHSRTAEIGSRRIEIFG